MTNKSISVIIFVIFVGQASVFADITVKDPYSLKYYSGPHKPKYYLHYLRAETHCTMSKEDFKEIWESPFHTKIIRKPLSEEQVDMYKKHFRNITESLKMPEYIEIPANLVGLGIPWVAFSLFGTKLIEKFILEDSRISAETLSTHVALGGEIRKYISIKELEYENRYELIQKIYYFVSVGEEERFFNIYYLKAPLRCPNDSSTNLSHCLNSCISITLHSNNLSINWTLTNDNMSKVAGYFVSSTKVNDILVEKIDVSNSNTFNEFFSDPIADICIWVEAYDKDKKTIATSNILFLPFTIQARPASPPKGLIKLN